MKEKITVIIPTYKRYDSTLPICLMSLALQTKSPDRIIVIDDSPIKKLYDFEYFKNILLIYKNKNIHFDYFHGSGLGMVPSMQMAIEDINDGWVLKIDDDHVLDSKSIENLYKHINIENIGAISGLVLDNIRYKNLISKPLHDINKIYNKLEDIYINLNIQMDMNQDDGIKYVEHLYSFYFFKRNVVEKYPLELQPSGYREDTIVTHEIYRKGYKLIVDPKVVVYHLYNKTIETKYKIKENEIVFVNRLKEWGIIPNKINVKFEEDKLLIFKDGKEYFMSFNN